MLTLQTLFIILVTLILCYLVVEGLLTRAVWVKGARKGAFSFRQWAHKRDRDEDPHSYWFAIIFYSASILMLLWLLLSDPAT